MNRQQLKEALPHGSLRQIARRSGFSEVTVSKWFSSSSHNERIENAALEVLAEIQQARQASQAKFEAALRGEKL